MLEKRGECIVKWTAHDVEMYEKERQYIDTAVIPLISLALSDGAKAAASGGEFVQLLAGEIERQLRGRLFLLPPFAYWAAETQEARIERLNGWTRELTESGMEHVFYVTSDRSWKGAEAALSGELFLLPAVPLEHMDEPYRRQLIQEQTGKLLQDFIARWM
jgi:hypothetical protein